MGQRNDEYLKCFWSKKQRDVVYSTPDYGWNARLLHMYFSTKFRAFANPNEFLSKTFLEELEARGFDLTTIRFSIKKKAPTGP